jgi:hypothetical protein
VVRRALLVLLIPLILSACGVSAGLAAAPSAVSVPPLVVSSQLQQWSSWSRTPAARRVHCAEGPEFGSGVFFLAAPPGRNTANWSCTVPVGASILVVAASMSSVQLPTCSWDYGEQVGLDGSASLDGTPVALRWLGPVDGPRSPGPHRQPEHTCALTGLTVAMTKGYHTLIAQNILSGLIGTVTVDITAE